MGRIMKVSKNDGFSLMAAIIAIALTGLLAAWLSTLLSNSFKSAKSVEMRSDLNILRQTILASIDCEKTLQDAGIDPNNFNDPSCNSSSAPGGETGPFLRLRRKSPGAAVDYLTNPLGADQSAKMGDWNIRVSCSKTEHSLVVRVSRPDPAAADTFFSDPMTNKPADWHSPKGLLFAGAGGIPICFSSRPSRIYAVTVPALAALVGTNCAPVVGNTPPTNCFQNQCLDIVVKGQVFNAMSACSRFCTNNLYVSGSIVECADSVTPNVAACLCVGQI